MNKLFAPRLLAALAASLILFAGCSGGGSVTSSGGPAIAPLDEKAAPGAGVLPAEVPAADADERQVARTASITLVVARPADAAARVREVAAQYEGYVAREDLHNSTELSAMSTLVLSVPADRVDAVLTALAALGTMTNRSTTSVDVTDRVVDVDARIRTLQDSIARLRALMDRAGTVTEIAGIERELTQRQSDLESLLAQQKNLLNRVERTPVAVTLTTRTTSDNPFLEGLGAAWEAVQGSLRFLLVAAGALLPFVVLGVLLWLPVRWAWRRRRPGADGPPTA